MAVAPHFDFDSVMKKAGQMASEKDAQASELLWGQIAARAVSDESFRRELAKNPESTITREADRLQVAVPTAELQKAKEIFSPAVPGIGHEKVEHLIFGTIDDVRKSFTWTLHLAVAVFIVGLVLLIVAVVSSFKTGQDTGTIVFGAGGVLSLIATLVMNPLDRIRRAGGNLVQIQMAYLAYYSQLHLLGTRNERLTPSDAGLYAKELREAAISMVGAVQNALQTSAPISGEAALSRAGEPRAQEPAKARHDPTK